MEKQDRLIILFDYYEKLLTESQRVYFTNYYFNDLSLSEIAENEGVSRNAVSKELKLTIEKLNSFEEKLKLYSKERKLKNIINKIDNEEIKEELNKIIDE